MQDELPGVLAWAVEGVIAWNGQGLGTSKAVEAATEKYRSETDVLDRFFEDECTFGPDLQVGKKTLFEAWERCCDAEGIDPGTQTTFTRTVGERGIIRAFGEKKVKGTRLWVGISLDIPPSDPPSAPSQNPSKQGGITDCGGHFSPDLEELSPESPREGNSGETGSNLPPAPQDEIYPRIAVFGNAGGPELATTVFPFILRGVDLLGIDSDWCDLETRRVMWERMARGGDLNPIHLGEISRSVNFDELPDVFGAFLEGGPGGGRRYASAGKVL